MENEHIFIEQAEYIDEALLLRWSATHPDEQSILRKLSQGGAKLITGPRGSGKTTLLLKSYHRLKSKSQSVVLPIYVNFKTSLKLEPLYKSNANASYWFKQWLVLKVYEGLFIVTEQLGHASVLSFSKNILRDRLIQLEQTETETHNGMCKEFSIASFEEEVKEVLSQTKRKRCVLLLDDAAHAFSSQQQKDFFDFFREIKSRIVSPKAAIYPGVTTYSSAFHVGHDAEKIDIWLKPDYPQYLEFMKELLSRRLPKKVFDELNENKDLLELICFASFGLPRALLNMIRTFYKEQDDEKETSGTKFDVDFSRKKAMEAISKCFESSWNIYLSLKDKMPIYAKFIETGTKLFSRMISSLKYYNKGKLIKSQAESVGVKVPMPVEVTKVFEFFQYSGLLLPRGAKSRGDQGTFDLFTMHYAALIEKNVFLGKTKAGAGEIRDVFKLSNPKLYPRTISSGLLGKLKTSEAFPLSLPPCQKCNTPRINEHAKFCHNCGAQLKAISIFETLVAESIKKLPLTEGRVQTIINHSNIRTIKDILIDHDNNELRSVPQIGPVWSSRIAAYAEEFIG